MSRIANTFAACKQEGRAALVTYIAAFDPDMKTSEEILNSLPDLGADVIELGMPFSDPMADGAVIQAASQRALKAGANVKDTIQMAGRFRKNYPDTPLILMGYFNPVFKYGIKSFVNDAANAGVDGVIIVDLPKEEEDEFTSFADKKGLSLIHLIAPTTGKERAKHVLQNASGFVYYISITGITGTASATKETIGKAVDELRDATDLPIVAGFGIKTPEQAAELSSVADGIVVGSSIIEHAQNKDYKEFVSQLASAVRKAA